MDNFGRWCKIKKNLTKRKAPNFNERDVFMCYLGKNIGHEESGDERGEKPEFLRAVLVLKKFNNEYFLGLPLTRKCREGKFYYNFEFNGEKSTVLLSQIRGLDSKRLKYRMGRVSRSEFKKIKSKLGELIGFTP